MIIGPYKSNAAVRAELSSHNASIRRVTVEILDDEEIEDAINFSDVRQELNSTGHNLVRLIFTFKTCFNGVFSLFVGCRLLF